jgi:phosphomannomutase
MDEVYKITGKFVVERADLKINKNIRDKVLEKCKSGMFTSFGKYKVDKTENLDGYKFFFSENEWLLIRPSGTEPLLRTYAEAETEETAMDILSAGHGAIMTVQ